MELLHRPNRLAKVACFLGSGICFWVSIVFGPNLPWLGVAGQMLGSFLLGIWLTLESIRH